MKQKSLLNFFNKIPKEKQAKEASKLKQEVAKASSEEVENLEPMEIVESDNEVIVVPVKRRNTVVEDESEAVPSPSSSKNGSLEKFSLSQESESVRTPSKKQKTKLFVTPTNRQEKKDMFRTPVNRIEKRDFASPQSNLSSPCSSVMATPRKEEDRYDWLVNIKDANGLSPDNPDYDKKTLFIPAYAWKNFTPFETQFWEIKSKNFDTVVFFKKGKFYELYENDADVGSREFDLKMTDRVNMRMVGVPEASFEYWAAKFLGRGHKVARVDQMETAVGKSLREKDGAKEKVIRRELTSILTAGTLTDPKLISTDQNVFCVSIHQSGTEFGISFVDTSTGEFYISSIHDDDSFTRIETVIAQIQPKEIIHEKNNLKILKKLKDWAPNALYSPLSTTDFWSPDKMFVHLNTIFDSIPAVIESVSEQGKHSLGGLVSYLFSVKLDAQLLSMKNFNIYDPIHHGTTLVLDGATLKNLEIIKCEGTLNGSLLDYMDHCVTSFEWQDKLTKLIDLERMLSRIHIGQCRLLDFLNVIDAFDYLQSLRVQWHEISSDSALLKRLCDKLVDLSEYLEPFKNGFDHSLARKEGHIIPKPGMNAEYDQALTNGREIEQEFAIYLQEQRKKLKTEVRYKDLGKELFQLEVPFSTPVPEDFMLMSKTKAVKRYWSPKIRSLVKEYNEAMEIKQNILSSQFKTLMNSFDQNYSIWINTVKVYGELDCLLSLATVSRSFSTSCRPIFLNNDEPSINFKELVHPCLAKLNENFIPNDISLKHPSALLVTGSNMGGKSTLLRQTCIGIILAHIGCYVPAAEAKLTVVDRIFTRIGAHDSIMSGQSTFMVELNETSKILKEATKNSMVILDELGRGTSTHDGDFTNHPNIGCYHMACHCNEEQRQVIFLYKFLPGISEKSYGTHVAAMAGVPLKVVERARQVAEQYESCQGETKSLDLGVEKLMDWSVILSNQQEMKEKLKLCWERK